MRWQKLTCGRTVGEMKYAFVVALFTLVQTAVGAADSAYTALRIMAKERGESALNQVVELRGRQGKPTPDVWRITLRDPAARGGLREVEIQRGKIISQRTPVSRPMGAPVNLNQLNLDSDGVFTIVNQETDKVGVVFDRIDFVLRSGTRDGAPVWTTELFTAESGRAGLLEISADSGTILRKELERAPGRDLTQNDRDFLNEDPGAVRSDRDAVDDEGDPAFRPGERISRFFGKVEQRFKKRGKQFESFFERRGFRDEESREER